MFHEYTNAEGAIMDNLQQAMVDAQWERRAAERQPYRVLAPRAPGAVCYWMALALVADGAGRDDLVQPALDAAGQAVEPSRRGGE